MKISHVSVAVREPERAAQAIAEIWGDSAHPFFPLPGAWIAFSAEEPSSQIEFYPDGTELEPGDTRDDYVFHANPDVSGFTATHITLKAPCDHRPLSASPLGKAGDAHSVLKQADRPAPSHHF